MTTPLEPSHAIPAASAPPPHHFRFPLPHLPLAAVFGEDWCALKAEAFARFFGTPIFLVAQTVGVTIWIGLNVGGVARVDLYPFILLNLAFSLQAAYAAPLILLAQTRQAERRHVLAAPQTAELLQLLHQNPALTARGKELRVRIEALTLEMHGKVLQGSPNP